MAGLIDWNNAAIGTARGYGDSASASKERADSFPNQLEKIILEEDTAKKILNM